MTISALPLVAATATASDQVYTVPVNTTWVVKKWTFNNPTGGALTITVKVNIGGSLEMLSAYGIASHAPLNPTELNGLTLVAGDTITINAGTGVTYVLSGIAIV